MIRHTHCRSRVHKAVMVKDSGDQNEEWARIFIPGKVRHFIFRRILKLGVYSLFLKGLDKNCSQPVKLYEKKPVSP